MMSPFTVSQTLSLENKFVLLIDEASQMKPEYAMGALARTKQVIVVGEIIITTNVFSKRSNEDSSFRNLIHFKFSRKKFYKNQSRKRNSLYLS